ncbi:MAG: glycosyltransferase family 2 protein, partial [Candidatus Planktophila sp.]
MLDALAANTAAASLPLIVYVDGPRGEADQAAVAEVVAVAQQATGFLSVEVRSSSENLGLYRSLTGGINTILAEYESIIVLEDDILTSPHFLQFMLDGLELYQDSPEVGSISGYTPPIRQELPETFFLRGADCWGWATWRDRWKLYRHDAKAMAREIRDRGLAKEFDLLGHYPYLAMLEGRAAGKNNSWAICWHASCFLAGKLILYPGKSLVSNIGFDNSGEHCGPSALLSTKIDAERPVRVQKIPLSVDLDIFTTYSSHFIVANQLLKKVRSLFRRVAKRILR